MSRVISRRKPPVFRRGHAVFLFEFPVKISLVRIAYAEDDVFDAFVGGDQQPHRLVEAELFYYLCERAAGIVFQNP